MTQEQISDAQSSQENIPVEIHAEHISNRNETQKSFSGRNSMGGQTQAMSSEEDDVEEEQGGEQQQEPPRPEVQTNIKPELSQEEQFKNMAAQERNKRKDAEKRFRETEKELDKLRAQMELINKFQGIDGTKGGEDAIPDYDEDPIGHLRAKINAQSEVIERLTTHHSESEKTAEQQREAEQLRMRAQNDIQSFARENPDFNDAYQFLVQFQAKEYQQLGYTSSQIQQLIEMDSLRIVEQAYANDLNPGQVAYNLAKVRGFNSGGDMSKQNQNEGQGNNMENYDNDRFEAMKRGSQANRSLGSSSFPGKNPQADVQDLLSRSQNLSDEEFEKQFQMLGRQGKLG